MHNYFAWNHNHLRHLSAGVVIKNDEDEILVHKLARIGGKYFLPKKTMLAYGSLEQAAMATTLETGWKMEILNYLGSIEAPFPAQQDSTHLEIIKTTIYFHCKPLYEVGRDPNDRDADSELHWVDIQELIDIFTQQKEEDPHYGIDESKVLKLLRS